MKSSRRETIWTVGSTEDLAQRSRNKGLKPQSAQRTQRGRDQKSSRHERPMTDVRI